MKLIQIIIALLLQISILSAEITEVAHFETPGRAMSVHLSDEYAFIADHSGGLRIIDISNPEHPEEAGVFDPDGFYVFDVYVNGNCAYLGEYSNRYKGLYTINISEIENPERIDYLETPRGVRELSVFGNHAFLTNDDSGLRVIDISNVENLEEVGEYDTPGVATDIFLYEGIAYICDEWPAERHATINRKRS